MRGMFAFVIILAFMAIIDLWGSNQLLAALISQDTARHFHPNQEIDLVANALNSRFMQWGAVGVMLSLFVWLVTRHIPYQESRRDAERREERMAFLEALKIRDEHYLGALSDLREGVEVHSSLHHESKEHLTTAINLLTIEVKQLTHAKS
jgi:hypothetical protein